MDTNTKTDEKLINVKLDGVSETLLIPFYLRYLESLRCNGMIKHKGFSEILPYIDYDFSDWVIDERQQLFIACRTKIFDDYVIKYINENPQGTIVNFAAGLSLRNERLDNGKVKFIDIDLPHVTDIRMRIVKKITRNSFISGSVFDFDWINKIPVKENVLFVVEGLLLYFNEDEIKKLFAALCDNFSNSQVLFETHSTLYIEQGERTEIFKNMDAVFKWGIDDVKLIEKWHEKLKMHDSCNIIDLYGDRMTDDIRKTITEFPKAIETFKVVQYLIN